MKFLRSRNITFPKIKGTKSVRTRLLSSCAVGTYTPTPTTMNFEMENGI